MKILSLLLFLLVSLAARAQFTCVTNANNTITITGRTGWDTNLIIPETISGLPVVEIGDQAFDGDFYLTNVSVPGSVLSIDHAAFNQCDSLATVNLGNGVTNIGPYAFGLCSSLTSFVIPDSVTTIGDGIFGGSDSLTNVLLGTNVTAVAADAFSGALGLLTINVSSNNPAFRSMGGVLFNKDQTILIAYPAGATGSYTIPAGVTTIGTSAFSGDLLSSVFISNGVTTIDDAAFYYCTNLMTATVPGTVTNFGSGIFEECTALGSITISNGVSSIGDGMFAICESLTNVTIPNSVTNIGVNAFYECSSLTGIVIPGAVTIIGDNAFAGCTALAEVTLPFGLNNIGEGAFSGCILTNIIIPKNVTNIGYGAFENCLNLTAAYFEGSPPSELGAFYPENIIDYYLPGTPGWDVTFDGHSTAPWYLPYPSILSFKPAFGTQSNAFSFTISWATNISVIVDACTNLSNPDWQPIQTNTLTAGSAYFSDPQWSNYPARFYRLRSE